MSLSMNFKTALQLGRVSNLPTVFTNLLVGCLVVTETTPLSFLVITLLFLGISCFYLAGMYFNDYCDRDWDIKHQKNRPIGLGLVSASTVLNWTLLFVLFGTILSFLSGLSSWVHGTAETFLILSTLVASLLINIGIYDITHKSFSLSPWLMGGCRFWVYLIAAYVAVPVFSLEIVLLASVGFCYVVGITYVARLEHLNAISSWWPLGLLFSPALISLGIYSHHLYSAKWNLADTVFYSAFSIFFLCLFLFWTYMQLKKILSKEPNIPSAVGGLIAGISLMDACFLSLYCIWWGAFIVVLAFLFTRRLHRWVAGT